MTQARHVPAWRAAVSLFTIVPCGGPATIDRAMAGRMLLWFPLLGGLLGVVAFGGMLAVEATGHGVARRLLAATVALAILGVITGGLHLDGLADTADGLGSRKPKDQALDIMRRSDTGPMGVAAMIFVLIIQVFALAALPAGWVSALALATATTTGRVIVLLAAGLPPARDDGLGALIAGAATRRTRLTASLAPLAAILAVGVAVGGPALDWRTVASICAGLGAGALLARTAVVRLGGTTGDVFGALIEVTTATALLAFALLY